MVMTSIKVQYDKGENWTFVFVRHNNVLRMAVF